MELREVELLAEGGVHRDGVILGAGRADALVEVGDRGDEPSAILGVAIAGA